MDGGPARRDGDGTLHVPAGTEAIELSYTGLSLLAPPKVRFKYRLGGADSTWHDAQGRRTAYYSRLAPGEYTFEVMAANNDGMWSTSPATARLVVAPLWWERRAVQGGALTLLLVVVGYGVRAVSLRRARARVAALEREQALNRERSRIARDLHDDLGARLAHIALIAETGQSAPLERISGAAREAMQTMDELVWTVNARNDTVENFASYATQFAEEHLRAAGVRCRFRVQADLDGRELNADTRRHMYLAFKEAVTNAVKHAQPSAVRISLGIEGGTLVLEVADDGCGLAPGASDPTGNGLKNMRERMLAIGGTLVVDSAPGRGARVVFRTPLNL